MELEIIQHKIHEIRGQKVMLDFDLALLYSRFPTDFMFELTETEFNNLRSQFVTSKKGGSRYKPFAFTEQGIAMLSSVLNSDNAIKINISIMRAFVAMRQFALTYSELKKRIEEIEKEFPKIYKTLNHLINKTHNHKCR